MYHVLQPGLIYLISVYHAGRNLFRNETRSIKRSEFHERQTVYKTPRIRMRCIKESKIEESEHRTMAESLCNRWEFH